VTNLPWDTKTQLKLPSLAEVFGFKLTSKPLPSLVGTVATVYRANDQLNINMESSDGNHSC